MSSKFSIKILTSIITMTNEEIQDEAIEEENLDAELDEDTDWKAEALKARGIAKRYKTKFEKTKIDVKAEEKAEKILAKKEGFDYAEKAYLKASGIGEEDFDLVFNWTKETGKSIDEILKNKYFQTELQDALDLRKSREAIPAGSKRAVLSSRDSVEYWLAKGELPPQSEKELRQKVVNAKMKGQAEKSQFSERPIV